MNTLIRWWRRAFTFCVLKCVYYYTHGRVASGPFKGLRYPPPFDCGNAVPAKLLGIYEKELHGIITGLSSSAFRYVINIGASEGYYAAGLSLLFPDAEVLAYEASSAARENLNTFISFNGLNDRVKVRENCDSKVMSEMGKSINPQETLVICDIEGGEVDVLNPEKYPWLRQSKIIFETHDFAHHGSSEQIIARFSASHTAIRLPTVPRTRKDLPIYLPGFLLWRVLLIVGDQRLHLGNQDFVILTPVSPSR